MRVEKGDRIEDVMEREERSPIIPFVRSYLRFRQPIRIKSLRTDKSALALSQKCLQLFSSLLFCFGSLLFHFGCTEVAIVLLPVPQPLLQIRHTRTIQQRLVQFF
ncbi:MAG: hypothetical protein MUF49_19945 [Oculatellaceae cyanobacterium Prado106]|nr:hypothetical protein [Oculatellaceae cyanobacterium Prado106]